MKRFTQLLKILGYVIGAAVVGYGFYLYLTSGARPPLLIALAVLVAGPLEDLLKAWVQRAAIPDEQKAAWSNLVDQATSIAFLIVLLWALLL